MKFRLRVLRRKNIKKAGLARRFLQLGLVLLVLGLVGGAVYFWKFGLAQVDYFKLKEIQVQGQLRSITQTQLLELAAVQKDVSLFALDLEAIQERLSRHPYFRQITLKRQLPDRLLIAVEEYEAVLVLSTGRFYYVDAEGQIFYDISESPASRDYPILSGIDEDLLLSDPMLARHIIHKALELKKAYEQSALFREIGLSEIHFELNLGFSVYPERAKYSIHFGERDFAAKTEKLRRVWEHFKDKPTGISSINLDYPEKVLFSL